MTTHERILAAIEQVAERLGPDLPGVVFVGATVAALYETIKPLGIRPTNDVDILVNTTLPAYYALMQRLKKRGFKESREEGAPVCRMELDGLLVDVMVSDPSVLGFSNRWYPEAVQAAQEVELPSGRIARAIPPVYFVATKLVAFEARGQGSPTGSKDIEDIVNLLVSKPELIAEIKTGARPVSDFVRERLRDWLRSEAFEDAVFGCFLPDEQHQRQAALFLDGLKAALS